VAKISFDALQSRIEEFWRQDEELDLVTDENGVVVVSPLSAFAFKSIQAIPEAANKAIEASRQYGEVLLPISLIPGIALTQQLRFVDFRDIPDRSFLQQSYYYPDLGLRLYLHLPASRYWEIVTKFTAMFSLLALVIFLVCISFFQRWVYGTKLIETAIRDPLEHPLVHGRLVRGRNQGA
jgi:C4-dicarboxylate-specific signal transduction histidine kinase